MMPTLAVLVVLVGMCLAHSQSTLGPHSTSGWEVEVQGAILVVVL